MSIKQRLTAAKQLVTRWLQLPHTIIRMLHEMFVNGGFEVQTPLLYHNKAQAIAYHGEFRTILQIGGDIIHFVPPPSLFATDYQWQQLYQHAQQQHQRQFHHILKHLSLFSTLSQRLGAVVGMLGSAVSWSVSEWHLLLNGWSPAILVAFLLFLMLSSGLLVAVIVHFGVRPLLLRWIQRQLQLR